MKILNFRNLICLYYYVMTLLFFSSTINKSGNVQSTTKKSWTSFLIYVLEYIIKSFYDPKRNRTDYNYYLMSKF